MGIIVSSNFMWDLQVDALLSKARFRLGWLKRTIVCSQFEHCVQVWRPSSEIQINKLERIQQRAVKLILSEEDHSYNNVEYLMRLRDLDFFLLENVS